MSSGSDTGHFVTGGVTLGALARSLEAGRERLANLLGTDPSYVRLEVTDYGDRVGERVTLFVDVFDHTVDKDDVAAVADALRAEGIDDVLFENQEPDTINLTPL